MVYTIKKGSDINTINAILKELNSDKLPSKVFDAEKFCGVIKLSSSPIEIQNNLRKEWG